MASVAAEIFAAGFVDDPVMRWLFHEDRHRKMLAFFEFIVSDALEGLESVHVLDDERAAAAWTPPGVPPWDDERNARFAEVVGALCDDGDMVRFGQIGDATGAAHPTEPHWYLGLLAARPEAQGTGAGTELLGRTLQLVDRDGLPAYLESSNDRNLTLYLRHGFEIIGEIPLPDGPTMTAMWRPAAG